MTYEESLDRCEEEIGRIDEAMDQLRKVREMEDVVSALEYRKSALESEAEGYRDKLCANDARERDALRREYERSLL